VRLLRRYLVDDFYDEETAQKACCHAEGLLQSKTLDEAFDHFVTVHQRATDGSCTATGR
jgi:hypothetical protein